MGFDDAVLRCLSKYVAFGGRARPSEIWWFMLLYGSVVVLSLLAMLAAPGLAPALLAVLAALTPPALAVTVRRLHDIGAAGWLLVFLIPGIGQFLMLVWLAVCRTLGW